MRPNPAPIAAALVSGGPMVGPNQPTTRITVDRYWWLNQTSGLVGTRPVDKLPIRYWQYKDNATNFANSEIEIPNLKTVIIDRQMTNQTGTIQVVMYNTITPDNGEAHDNPDTFGRPGWFSYARGQGPDAKARWGQTPNLWSDNFLVGGTSSTQNAADLATLNGLISSLTTLQQEQLAYVAGSDEYNSLQTQISELQSQISLMQATFPSVNHGLTGLLRENALLRCYQGYGAADMALPDAIANGYLQLTGVFLVDNVQIESGGGGSSGGSGGLITLNGRDMGKLLVDQTAWPPTIPQGSYGSAGLQYVHGDSGALSGVTGADNEIVDLPMQYQVCSANPTAETANNPIRGHLPAWSLTDNPTTFYVSENFDSPTPDNPPSIQFNNIASTVSAVKVAVPPGHQNCTCYISIYGQQNLVFYSDTGWTDTGLGTINGIPYVMKFGVSQTAVWVNLPSGYATNTIRFTFTDLETTPDDSSYHASVYQCGVGVLTSSVGGTTGYVEGTQAGNYYDYSTIVADFCLWAGWYLKQDTPPGDQPTVFGVIENTGAFNELGPIPGSTWDQQPLISCIQTVAQIVGFIFRIGERGEVLFFPPNIYAPGNYDEDNNFLGEVFPVLDESVNLTDYVQTTSDQGLVSEIIVSPEDPYLFGGHPNNNSSTVGVTRFTPGNIGSLRGINKPAMLGTVLNVPVDLADQNAMAELLAVQCYLTMRQGQATCMFDPSITPDTQIKIYDRVTGESNVHYVCGTHSEHDIDQGNHLSTISTYWLGNQDTWVIRNNRNTLLAGSSLNDAVYNDNGILVSDETIQFLTKSGSARVRDLVGSQKVNSLSVAPSNNFASDLNANAYGDTALTPITTSTTELNGDPVDYNQPTSGDSLGVVTNATVD
jgi:hypothetical protein